MMTLYLKDEKIDRPAREIARLERGTIDAREEKRRMIRELQGEIAKLSILDDRDHGEMLYDDDGIPR